MSVAAGEVPADALGGRYRLVELLGVGGSASTFRAQDLRDPLVGDVAVKTLHPHLCRTAAGREAFLREADRVRRLHHPGIARVLGSGVHDTGGAAVAWIALELMRGGSLAEYVAARGPLPVADAVEAMGGVLDALGVAHAAGLVHRDVTPANILLRCQVDRAPTAEDVCLVDFGLADRSGRDVLGGDVLQVTAGPTVIGNVAYLSPEQAQGRAVTTAADLYQAGATLYFLLTGQPPYPRATSEQTARAHVSAPPPVPSTIVPAARPLDGVVTRAMAKAPEHRFADTARFHGALLDAVHEAPAAQSPVGAAPLSHATLPMPRVSAPHVVPAPSRGAAAPPAAPTPTHRRGGAPFAVALVAVIAAVLVRTLTWSAATTAPPTAGPTPVASSATRPTPTPPEPSPSPPSTTPAPTAPPSVATVTVPPLSGMLAEARATLAAAGLGVGAVERVDSPRPEGTILSQRPAAGEAANPDAVVDLTVASGRNAVPDVSTLDVAAAIVVLQDAGFTTGVDGTSPGSVVTATVPAAGADVALGARVLLRVGQQLPATSPATPVGTPSGERRP